MRGTLKERFEAKVDRSGGPDACHPWTASLDGAGYGQMKDGGKVVRAHRVAYRFAKGDPGPLDVLHSCDNPPCQNDRHLFLGTPLVNARDRESKGRGNQARGDRNGRRTKPEAWQRAKDLQESEE